MVDRKQEMKTEGVNRFVDRKTGDEGRGVKQIG